MVVDILNVMQVFNSWLWRFNDNNTVVQKKN